MIVPELQLGELINTIPTYEIDPIGEPGVMTLPLTYNFGVHKTLLNFLRQSRKNQSPLYPLVWLILPEKEKHEENAIRLDSYTIILAINTRKEWLNPDRYNQTFRTYLIPNLELIKQALSKANNITLLSLSQEDGTNIFFEVVKRPNYGSPETFDGGDSNQTTDYWDAIQITFKARFTNNCLLDIIYNTNNLTQWQY